MDKYENMGMVGEGSYGMVMKCRHKESGQLVAIKKFLESEDDKMVKKIALREIRMLKSLRHENLVNLLEVFRRKKRLYLVFEFVDHTVLDDLERCPNGLDDMTTRRILWQVIRGIDFCHSHNIIHRDVKPENILVSKAGVVKLCDFGFARSMVAAGENYTDYVATRWYRGPELLVGDTKYGKPVDIWAIGCLVAEVLTGEPLFPGDSDIDQLFHVVKCFGELIQRHKTIFQKNPLFAGMRLPEVKEIESLEKKFPKMSKQPMDLMKKCLILEPNQRPSCTELLRHEFFTTDAFHIKFPQELMGKLRRERENNPLLSRFGQSKSEDVATPRKKRREEEKKKENKSPSKEKEVVSKESPGREKYVATKRTSIETVKPLEKTSSFQRKESEKLLVERKKKITPPPSRGKKETGRGNSPLFMPSLKQSQYAGNQTLAPMNHVSVGTSLTNTTNTPLQSGPPPLRVSDKMKKAPPNFYKKAPVTPGQPLLTSEKTTLSVRLESRERPREEPLMLPELRPSEAPPSRGGGGGVRGAKLRIQASPAVPLVTHITTLDPFAVVK